MRDPFGAAVVADTPAGRLRYYSLRRLEKEGIVGDLEKLPFSIRVLLENVLRGFYEAGVPEEAVYTVASWPAKLGSAVPVRPSRVLLQDYTGVPIVLDLAAMREKLAEYGCDPRLVDSVLPAHLVVDHSVSVDYYATSYALERNMELEMKRYAERYRLLRWAQRAFSGLRVVPPGNGIIHGVNLEHLVRVVHVEGGDPPVASPEVVIGADSHTPMAGGAGVLAWGAGGIEVEAVMLGEPYQLPLPGVLGVKLVGEPPEKVTAYDIALAVTEAVRSSGGAVDMFVEFFGPGVEALNVFDRATIANMAPEYGATTGYFPVDKRVPEFLRVTGRGEAAALVEAYMPLQGLWRSGDAEPSYTRVIEIDLGSLEPSVAGPEKPYQRIPLTRAPEPARLGLAALASCTSTVNPWLVAAAALAARRAVERGLCRKPWVKTSFTPGSRAIVAMLRDAGLMAYLEALGFHVAGYGCGSCIGNSGSLPEDAGDAAVISGNRNFPGRVHPRARRTYLASPPLVVAYAVRGDTGAALGDPVASDPNGEPVLLQDLLPSRREVERAVAAMLRPEYYIEARSRLERGGPGWESLDAPESPLYPWDPASSMIRRPPFLDGFTPEEPRPSDIRGARVLLMLGDDVTTDHISPAGPIPPESPAGRYLSSLGVPREMLGTYGARRGNHEVMVRGAFTNPSLRNKIASRPGGYTVHWPSGEELPVYEAARRYMEEGTPLIVIAGERYGMGSSRDWAAKVMPLLGVRAVIAKSFERIHRANLAAMGVLPLQFLEGEDADTLGLRGDEVYTITGIEEGLWPRKRLHVVAEAPGRRIEFDVVARLDTPAEVQYYIHGGLLSYALRRILRSCTPRREKAASSSQA